MGLWPYLVLLVMLCLPVYCLVSTLQAAPTPEHRAEVEAQPANPTADWAITIVAFGGCGVVLLVALLKNGQTVELPGGGFFPEIVRPAAPGPLAPEAQNHWISDLPLVAAGQNKPWERPGWRETRR